ncbi:MAG: penicillin-binding protein 2 [Actinobacteria bacterium]|nr:penicillin-binding protein 2 [Actinomycetota bacterium]
MPVMGDPNKRIRWTLLFFVIFFIGVAAKAAFLQTVDAKEISSRVDMHHVEEIDTPAHRGTIFDRSGNELAVGVAVKSVVADPLLIKDPWKIASLLAPLLKTDPATLANEITANKNSGFVYLARKIDESAGNQVDQLVKDNHISGIETRPEEKRVYPQNQLAAQVIGYAGTDNTGLAGMELKLDSVLKGTPGRQRVVTAADGSQIQTISLTEGVPGTDVWLTLDQSIQFETEKVLTNTVKQWKAKGAEAVVMNPRTGAIYAMASVPTVNANDFNQLSDEQRRNRPVVDTYEPGSVFKIVTASGSLEDGVVRPGQVFHLPPTLDLGGYTIEDAVSRGPVDWDLGKILVHSSNIGTDTIGMMLGKDRLAGWINRFGFLSRTGIDFPGEATGNMPPTDQWTGSTIGNIPIGQGITVTPLQLAAAYAAVANGGVTVSPHLVERIGNRKTPVQPGHRIISQAIADQMTAYFTQVVNNPAGAPEAQIEGYQVAGKTGTAQKIVDGKYSNSDYIGTFAGYAPADDPQLLIVVKVDDPHPFGGGSTVAAPAFQKIMQFSLDKMRITP